MHISLRSKRPEEKGPKKRLLSSCILGVRPKRNSVKGKAPVPNSLFKLMGVRRRLLELIGGRNVIVLVWWMVSTAEHISPAPQRSPSVWVCVRMEMFP